MASSADLFKRNLRSLVEQVGWNQSEFGRQIGMTPAQARNYMEGKSTPPFETLDKIAAALGVSPQDLYREDGPAKPRIETVPLSDAVRPELTLIAKDVAQEAARTVIAEMANAGLIAAKAALTPWQKRILESIDKLTDAQRFTLEEVIGGLLKRQAATGERSGT